MDWITGLIGLGIVGILVWMTYRYGLESGETDQIKKTWKDHQKMKEDYAKRLKKLGKRPY